MSQKWICNKCGYETTDKPEHKNEICKNCNKGRFQVWNKCECGKWFHPQRISQIYCSKDCMYKYRETGGKKGKHYPNTQRARISICPVCGEEFRAVKDFKGRNAIYCSKECWCKRGKKKRIIIRTPEFRKWKSEIFKRDNFTCQICGSKKGLEAHHIKEKANFPEFEYDVNNGVCLCHECHIKTDNYGYRAKKKKAVKL